MQQGRSESLNRLLAAAADHSSIIGSDQAYKQRGFMADNDSGVFPFLPLRIVKFANIVYRYTNTSLGGGLELWRGYFQ